MKTEIDFSIPSYIDNFLPEEDLKYIRELTLNQHKTDALGYYPHHFVASEDEFGGEDSPNPLWNWYATHMIYDNDIPQSNYCERFYKTFISKFYKMEIIKSLIRIKVNFYPWTETLKLHEFHTDYPIDHCGALFSINTCDGYTEFEDGTKVDSVENRMMFFNPKQLHRSTTTTTDYGRFNINFNFL